MKRLTPPWAYPVSAKRKGWTPNESVGSLYRFSPSLQPSAPGASPSHESHTKGGDRSARFTLEARIDRARRIR